MLYITTHQLEVLVTSDVSTPDLGGDLVNFFHLASVSDQRLVGLNPAGHKWIDTGRPCIQDSGTR